MKTILVTGGAGFIGSNLIDKLLSLNYGIVCVDNFDPFYDPRVKYQNIRSFLKNPHFKLVKVDIRNSRQFYKIPKIRYFAVIHLAAKAGVRPSILNPTEYTEVNILGTQNVLELARSFHVKQFIFASSSSVYGNNPKFPWKEDSKLQPISPYATTKIAGELLGETYSKLFGIRFIGLRFFTVYGERQRPDLAIHKFSKLILEDKPIDMYGDGKTKRDYTYIGDVISAITNALDYQETNFEIINIGNNQPIELRELIKKLEKVLDKKAVINRLPPQKGDVETTFANISKARKLLSYNPQTSFSEGLEKFRNWIIT